LAISIKNQGSQTEIIAYAEKAVFAGKCTIFLDLSGTNMDSYFFYHAQQLFLE
jgi:hypothetical protein